MGRSTTETDRRRAILRAAVDVFARKGYHGCRISDVAKEAGVAYGLVYHYFENKDQLLKSVFDEGWGGFIARITEVIRGPGSLETRVGGIVSIAYEAYRRDPRGVRVLILEVGRSPVGGPVNRGAMFFEVVQLAAGMFLEAKDRGELRPEADPLLCATLLFGAVEMGLTAFLLGVFERKDHAALERAKAHVTQCFLRGVLAQTSDEPQV